MKTNPLLMASSLLLAVCLFQGPLARANMNKMTSTDTALVAQIRQDLAEDSSLSAYAQNVKITAVNGKVTLKGPVQSDLERMNIYDKVVAESGVNSVDNKLEVRGAANAVIYPVPSPSPN